MQSVAPPHTTIFAGRSTCSGHAYFVGGGGLHATPGGHSMLKIVSQPSDVLSSAHDFARGGDGLSGGAGTGRGGLATTVCAVAGGGAGCDDDDV